MTIRAEVEGVGTLEFPDGTDPEVIQRTVKNAVAGRYQTPSQRRGESMDERMAKAPPARNVMSSVWHGAVDAAAGLSQIAGRAADAMGMPSGSDYPFIASPDVVEAGIGRARQQVNEKFGEPNPGGIDFIRAITSGGLATPLAGPVGTAPSLIGRGAQAARAGAIQGAMQPVEKADDNTDFARKKLFQAGTGAVVAGGAQPLMELGMGGISGLAKSAVDRARGFVRGSGDDIATKIAYQTLASQGIKFNELQKEVQQSIVKDVRDALSKYGGVNAGALARQADFKELGVDAPLKPWITRDPIEWGQYKNLEGAKDAGESLIRAKQGLEQTLHWRIQKLRGGNTGDQYQSGTAAERALASHHEAKSAQVDALYSRFRSLAPNQAADPKRFSESVNAKLDEALAQEPLPENLRNYINKIAGGEIPLTPQVLFQLQKAANRAARGGGDSGHAAGLVSRSVDEELDAFAGDLSAVGPQMRQAYEALREARSAHKALKIQEETIPALKAVAEGKFAAEDFFKRYVQGADVKEVAALWTQVGGETKQAARSQLVDYLKKAAAGEGSIESAPFQQASFLQALGDPGMRQKIQIIMGQKGLNEVERIGRVAEAALRTPGATRYNTSGTAIELANLAKRGAGAVPFIGPQLQGGIAGMQASNMQKPASVGQGVMDPFYEELLKRMRSSIGFGTPLLGMGAAGEVSR